MLFGPIAFVDYSNLVQVGEAVFERTDILRFGSYSVYPYFSAVLFAKIVSTSYENVIKIVSTVFEKIINLF
jgi:hypothetical protein